MKFEKSAGKPAGSKLSKLRMPESEGMDMAEMSVDSEGGLENEESPESMSDVVNEEEMEGGEGGHDLAEVADDDLMAEVEKRGLMRQMGKSKAKSDNYSEM